jgi:DNA-binding NarL/FixJ family response regulator
MTAFHVIIADDHPLFRDALKLTLAGAVPDLVITELASLDELLKHVSETQDADLVLLDLKMPGEHNDGSATGLTGLLYLRSHNPGVPVIIVSAAESPSVIRRCLSLGAAGFIPKSSPVEQIREAVSAVLAGEIWLPPGIDLQAEGDDLPELTSRLSSLTPQQVRVLTMLGEGLLNKQIAYELGVSEATVKAHVSAILQKLGVDSRTQAVIAMNRIANVEGLDLLKPAS